MTPIQIAKIIKHRLLTREWQGSGEFVFAYNCVKITNNPERQAFLALSTPLALILIGDFQADPVHGEEPDYLIGPIVVKIGVSQEDSLGEAAILGSNKTGGLSSSKGRGVDEIGVELMDTIRNLNLNDGISIQFTAKGNSQAIYESDAHYRATKDYAFDVIASGDPEYSEPDSLAAVPAGGGVVNLSWVLPAAAADQLGLVMRRKAGGRPALTQADGSSVAIGGFSTSVVNTPGAGQWTYTLWMQYVDNGILTLSPPVFVTVTAT